MVSIKNSKEIRKTILRMIAKSQSSHIGSALSIVDILNVIYGDVFQENDKVILSKGHAGSALYATLAEYGNINKKILINNYCQNGSKFGGHVTYGSMSGVDASAGSLGHGMPIGCGFALANKRRKVFVITGDGELNEGSNRESVMFGYHQRLSNLIRIIDKNNQQSFGDTQETIKIHDLFNILESFGWHVQEVNGHNINELRNAFNNTSTTLPNVIIANTIKGKGVSFMENNVKFHYKPPTSKELDLAINELDTGEMN